MSLVIYHDGIMYADTKAWGGPGVSPPGNKDKVLVADSGDLVGITSGALGMPTKVIESYNSGEKFVEAGDHQTLVLRRDGSVWYWADDACIVGPLTCKFSAVGTGSKYALGVLRHGGTVKEAFKIASELDYFTDKVFRTFRI
jgi:hypothetical protein